MSLGDENMGAGLRETLGNRGADAPRAAGDEGTIAVPFETLRKLNGVLMVASPEKMRAASALLASGIVNGLIVDGDAALRMAQP